MLETTIREKGTNTVERSEALTLHKNQYGEADYILVLLTRDFGKIRGLAKNAKTSRKRFGGRLEPFVHLRVRFRRKGQDMKFVEDAEVIRVFSALMEDVELFTWGSFVLECTDILLPEEEPNHSMFDTALGALGDINSGRNPLASVLGFQLSALSISGYKPDFDHCVSCRAAAAGESVFFSIEKGGILCGSCDKAVSGKHIISRNILLNQDILDSDKEAINYIKALAEFTKYHTGKEIKSLKFLEEIIG